MKNILFAVIVLTFYLLTKTCIPAFADNTKIGDMQKIIAEYKTYLNTINPKIRDEIVAFRRAIADLNRQKREKYQSLSPEAQNYLHIEQQFKNRLNGSNKTIPNTQ